MRRYSAILAFLGDDTQASSETLPERLLTICRRLRLTQADLAARVGQDEHQICRWKQGRFKPHPWIVGRLDLELRGLEGRPVENRPGPNFFDLTRWRRRPPKDLEIHLETFGDRLRAAGSGLA